MSIVALAFEVSQLYDDGGKQEKREMRDAHPSDGKRSRNQKVW